MIVVSDTSPITSLITIGRIDLLHNLFDTVLIPPAVERELLAFHKELPEFIRVEAALLDALEHDAGFYLSKQIRSDVLRSAGE